MTIHDFSRPGWGHAVHIMGIIDGGLKLRVMGHGGTAGRLPVAGDFLILPNEGQTTRYQVKSCEAMRDPADMWRAELAFAPRERP